MREYLLRLLRRGVPVALALAVLGYLYARLFLMVLRQNAPGGGGDDMLWRLPLALAALGFAFMALADALLVWAGRRKRALRPGSPPEETAFKPVDPAAPSGTIPPQSEPPGS